jgi:hypothetical protein
MRIIPLTAIVVVAINSAAQVLAAPATPKQEDAISSAIKDTLLDPDSAQLSGIETAISPNGTLSACGYINAKNAYGGYTGKAPFFGSFRGETFDVRSIAQDRDSTYQVINRCQMIGLLQ